jgi:hypothetical protein
MAPLLRLRGLILCLGVVGENVSLHLLAGVCILRHLCINHSSRNIEFCDLQGFIGRCHERRAPTCFLYILSSTVPAARRLNLIRCDSTKPLSVLPIHKDLFGLPVPIAPKNCLKIIRWVPKQKKKVSDECEMNAESYQLASKITTRLADWRLIPMFPAIVDTKNNLQSVDLKKCRQPTESSRNTD